MRILYIAKHGQAVSNDDEGAIAHALKQLGHEVHCVQENEVVEKTVRAMEAIRSISTPVSYNFVLFHKWDAPELLARIPFPKVFWWFDLVDFPDPTLRVRCEQRVDWMRRITPLVDLGFMSDGDWVDRDRTGKLVWLTQGADERVVGRGDPQPFHLLGRRKTEGMPKVVMFGGRKGGQRRESFVDEMRERWGLGFQLVERGVHGFKLRDHIASVPIVVAPDGPVTDRYWSNRVYLMAGFGAFLIHPLCKGLTEHFASGSEIVFYRNRNELWNAIEAIQGNQFDEYRNVVSDAALKRTQHQHLYRHRCERLIEVVKGRLKI